MRSNRFQWVFKAVIILRSYARRRGLKGRYGMDTSSMRTKVRWKNVCACPVVAGKVIKASIEECDVSILQNSVMKKMSVQRKSGPATPPARVTMSATITSPVLAGLEVISPAFLFWTLTDPEPTGPETLRRDLVGSITGVADL